MADEETTCVSSTSNIKPSSVTPVAVAKATISGGTLNIVWTSYSSAAGDAFFLRWKLLVKYIALSAETMIWSNVSP